MVTVSNYRVVETEEGTYVRLILSGDLEMVQSERTGNYYATIKQASISATFDEEMAKRMLGKQLPGPSNGSKSNRTKSKRTVELLNFTIAGCIVRTMWRFLLKRKVLSSNWLKRRKSEKTASIRWPFNRVTMQAERGGFGFSSLPNWYKCLVVNQFIENILLFKKYKLPSRSISFLDLEHMKHTR
jgi:metal-sulfur cluster biosynthetic enzyme